MTHHVPRLTNAPTLDPATIARYLKADPTLVHALVPGSNPGVVSQRMQSFGPLSLRALVLTQAAGVLDGTRLHLPARQSILRDIQGCQTWAGGRIIADVTRENARIIASGWAVPPGYSVIADMAELEGDVRRRAQLAIYG